MNQLSNKYNLEERTAKFGIVARMSGIDYDISKNMFILEKLKNETFNENWKLKTEN